MITGFFAYPSDPKTIGEAICNAVQEINQSGQAEIVTWDRLGVGGKIVIDEIIKAVDRVDLFCADLTGQNPNVMFEVGYAIGKNKRIWLILDTSIDASKSDFEQLRTLTTIGYSPYCSSRDIVRGFYQDQPYADLKNTVFGQVVEPNLSVGEGKVILLGLTQLDQKQE